MRFAVIENKFNGVKGFYAGSLLRAGLIERPEQYRWNSLGYHVQTNNRDNFLSTDFGLKEFNSKHEKKPKPIKGLDGMYSLKRLSGII